MRSLAQGKQFFSVLQRVIQQMQISIEPNLVVVAAGVKLRTSASCLRWYHRCAQKRSIWGQSLRSWPFALTNDIIATEQRCKKQEEGLRPLGVVVSGMKEWKGGECKTVEFCWGVTRTAPLND